MSFHDNALIYASYFERISPDNLDELRALLADDIVFIDPFNKLYGPDKMVAVFDKMFDQMTNPAFEVLDVVSSQDASYMKWRMTGIVNAAPQMPFDILGMSEIRFNAAGKVICHHDHWDSASQLLAKIPYIGAVIRPVLATFVLPQH